MVARAAREHFEEVYAHTRYDFINQMEGEISKPILPAAAHGVSVGTIQRIKATLTA